MAKAREIPGLSCDQPYGDGAALILDVRTAELADHAAGVLDTEDIERVHDMRVATRRLRAALEVFEPCFPSKPFRAVLRDVKALADVLGERRDRDVAIASLKGFEATIAAPDRPGVSSLVARLTSEQRVANEALAEHVTGGRLESLMTDLRELVSQAYAPGRAPRDAPRQPVAAPLPTDDQVPLRRRVEPPSDGDLRQGRSPSVSRFAAPRRLPPAPPDRELDELAKDLGASAKEYGGRVEPSRGSRAEPT